MCKTPVVTLLLCYAIYYYTCI